MSPRPAKRPASAATRPQAPIAAPTPTPTLPPDVARLLADSRAAHAAYRRAADARVPALDQIRIALDARLAAHAADPDHRHPAWYADPAAHDSLVAFYERKLSR